MKFCYKCGEENNDDAVYCNKCGEKFDLMPKQIAGCQINPTYPVSYQNQIARNESGLTIYPLSLRKTGKVLGISLIISIAIMIITVVVGVFVLASNNTENKVFDIQVGWPVGWFKISHLTLESSVSIGVSNWVNLIGDFIFYLLLCFVLAYIGEMFYASVKNKNK